MSQFSRSESTYSVASREAAAARLDGATWIAHDEGDVPAAGRRPAYVFRREFALDDVDPRASLSLTAHGIYEVFLNGARVGDEELAPGFTSYQATLHVQTIPVGAYLRPGSNELRVVLSDGWYRGRHGYDRVADSYGTRTAFIARLDAGATRLVSDISWRSAESEIVAADLMDGQTSDLRRIGREAWQPVIVSDDPLTARTDRLAFSPAPPVRRTDEVHPVSIRRLDADRQIVDFGTMLNGWVRLSALGDAGSVTTLTHGEALGADGDLTLGHLDAITWPNRVHLPVGQRDQVVSRGVDGDVFEPRHTTHGFRYVAVDGAGDLEPTDIVGVMVRSDLRPTATFTSSSDDLNRLHDIAVQTWRTNSCDVPTDCPTRERFGYTGDYQIYAHTAAFIDDVDGFSRKWLRSLADDQFESGMISNVAPRAGQIPDPVVRADGSSGWGDAATVVPWELYLAYGDASVLADSFDMMRRWVDFAAGVAASGRAPKRRVERPEPLPHEQYLWDTGYHWGEWSEPGAVFELTADRDEAIVATAYLSRSADIVARSATILGDPATAAHYAELSRRAADAWRTEFWDGARLTIETQATYCRGLAFGLFDDADVPAATARLVDLIHAAGDHLATGFLTTPMLLPTLAEHGHAELAYRLLFAEDEPGWMVMLRRGATAIWEAWDGISADGTPKESLDHYSKGAVISFLHEYVAGLASLEPAWARFRVRPMPGGGVTHARVTHDSPLGRIEVAWALEGTRLVVDVAVPDGAAAEICLPNAAVAEVGAGRHAFEGRVA